MHTFASLSADLDHLAIPRGAPLLVHSSMRAIGPVDGGAETVLDVLIQHRSTGLLLLPTHTWMEWNNPGLIFDPAVEPSCVGILSELFRRRPHVVRSRHPTHSIAGLGLTAATFLAGEEHTRTPCPRDGCWGRLYDIDARILFLGAPLRTNTFLHSVEEWHGIPDRLAAEPTPFRIRGADGALVDCPQFRHASSLGDVSRYYGKIEPALLSRGIASEGRFGDARCIVCDARAMADFVGDRLRADPHLFEGDEPIG